MTNIVERLRDEEAIVISGLYHSIPTMREAADEIERLERALVSAQAALAELVRLKDMHDEIEARGGHQHPSVTAAYAFSAITNQMRDEYDRCKPLAWETARALASAKGETHTGAALDARRYRWLRDKAQLTDWRIMEGHSTKALDAAIDAALSGEPGEK